MLGIYIYALLRKSLTSKRAVDPRVSLRTGAVPTHVPCTQSGVSGRETLSGPHYIIVLKYMKPTSTVLQIKYFTHIAVVHPHQCSYRRRPAADRVHHQHTDTPHCSQRHSGQQGTLDIDRFKQAHACPIETCHNW